MQIVSFKAGLQRYGLPIIVVREVVRLPALLDLSSGGPAFCGLLNLRGVYLAVLDARVLVGATPDYDLSKQVIVVGQDRPAVGLLVDQVEQVTIGVLDSYTVLQGPSHSLLSGVVRDAHGDILLMDPAALVWIAERQGSVSLSEES